MNKNYKYFGDLLDNITNMINSKNFTIAKRRGF